MPSPLYQAIVDGGNGTYSGSTPTQDQYGARVYLQLCRVEQTEVLRTAQLCRRLRLTECVCGVYGYSRRYTVGFIMVVHFCRPLPTWRMVAVRRTHRGIRRYPVSSAEDYPFEGWVPTRKNITGDTESCYAQFGSPLEVKEITDSWGDYYCKY